ncbi:MAG TPA: hypothetical protein VES40_17660 [Ilumatobacteraceae bacterium]|nr:hypothetical protein [Ilumatobacteraceae bacterium]
MTDDAGQNHKIFRRQPSYFMLQFWTVLFMMSLFALVTLVIPWFIFGLVGLIAGSIVFFKRYIDLGEVRWRRRTR